MQNSLDYKVIKSMANLFFHQSIILPIALNFHLAILQHTFPLYATAFKSAHEFSIVPKFYGAWPMRNSFFPFPIIISNIIVWF